MRDVSKRRGWYDALRQTDVCIPHGAYDGLKKATPELRCLDKTELWCGLYSQLELRWVSHEASRGSIEDFVEWTFKDPTLQKARSKGNSLQGWIDLIAESTQNPQWKDSQSKRRSFRSRLIPDKGFTPRLKTSPQSNQSNRRKDAIVENRHGSLQGS